nr:M48 family metallopeptidase [Bacteroidales bacterium]
PGKVTVRNNRTNWGSCSKSGNISLNIHLMRLTPELADFVIVHELCHLIHKNHGPQFHALLNSLCNGRERELNRLLKQQRPQVLFVTE